MVGNTVDIAKYEEIYSGYRDYMYCVGLCILRDRDASEDVVKQAFEYIAQHLDQFGSVGTLYGVREQVARLVARMATGN